MTCQVFSTLAFRETYELNSDKGHVKHVIFLHLRVASFLLVLILKHYEGDKVAGME